jgi:hypothetical protein
MVGVPQAGTGERWGIERKRIIARARCPFNDAMHLLLILVSRKRRWKTWEE